MLQYAFADSRRRFLVRGLLPRLVTLMCCLSFGWASAACHRTERSPRRAHAASNMETPDQALFALQQASWHPAARAYPLRSKASAEVLSARDTRQPRKAKRAALSLLKLPAGFSIEIYGKGVPHARAMALGANGTVFVSTRKGARVYALVDKDADYRTDEVHTIAVGSGTPHGIAYRDGSLYVAEAHRLWRLDDIERELGQPTKPLLVTGKLPDDITRGLRSLRFGPDGWLYMPIGAACNACQRPGATFASIARMQPDGSQLEVFASGVRSSFGFDWHPQTRDLWFTENGRDTGGEDTAPDELNHAPQKGLHFGFPHCHAGILLDPQFGAGHPCTQFEVPIRNLDRHVAVLGMRFYTGNMFPERYRNAVILAEHGTANGDKKLGYRVMIVRLAANRALSYEPLVTGFVDERTNRAWGRPVDVEILADGSVLISDDRKGVIYRVTYQG